MENEVWKPILGLEGIFEVSNLGRIKSKERVAQFKRKGNIYKRIVPEKILKQTVNRSGYLKITLKRDNNEYGAGTKVHKIVATTFLENPENKLQINHKDLNKQNNKVSNLEWVTARENAVHYVENGLKPNKLIGSHRYKIGKSIKWVGKISIKNKSVYLGTFDTELEAHQAYIKADEDLKHGINPISKLSHRKLDKTKADEIRALKGVMDKKEVAEKYGICYDYVGSIWNNKFWT